MNKFEMAQKLQSLLDQAELDREAKKDMKEIWEDIDGFQGKYQVSNLGNVMSLNYNNTGKSKLLTPMSNQKGYLLVALSKNNHRTMKQIHRLVAEAFIPNPDNLPQVNHKDENPKNNTLSNLEWCDAKYNNNYGSHPQKMKEARKGTFGINSTCKSILCIETNTIYSGAYEAQQKTGISNGNINQVCRGKRKTAGGYHWKYMEEEINE